MPRLLQSVQMNTKPAFWNYCSLAKNCKDFWEIEIEVMSTASFFFYANAHFFG